jgi:hypothetical protein
MHYSLLKSTFIGIGFEKNRAGVFLALHNDETTDTDEACFEDDAIPDIG